MRTPSGTMPDESPPNPPSSSGCHVVRLRPEKGVSRAVAASCDLPDDIRAAVVEAAAPWRDPPYVTKRLRAIVERHGLPGIAVLWETVKGGGPPTPPPITMPFEPIELNEAHPTLCDLCGASPDTAAPRPAPPKASAWRRFLVRLGMPVGILFFLGFELISAATASPRNPWMLLRLPLFVGTLLVVAGTVWWLSGQWLIIPGGLVVRRSVYGKVGVMLSRYTPADSMLYVRPMPPGWEVQIWRGRRHVKRMLTGLELSALLGAWQSPLPAPETDRLSDLI